MSGASATRHALWRARGLLALAVGLAAAVGPAPVGPAGAAAEVRWRLAGETGLAATLSSPLPHRLVVDARVEAAGGSGSVGWRLTADAALPVTVSGDGRAQVGDVDWALEEATVSWQRDAWMASAGRERLPLEAARLLLPFAVEPVSPSGLRVGVWGARLACAEGPTRLRLAVVEDVHHAGRALPVVSVRRQGGAAEVEGHVAWTDEGAAPVAGVTASGLVRDLVVYGELWHARDGRYVVGVSGFWGDALWTVEAGRVLSPDGLAVQPMAAAQVGWQQGPDVAWTVGSQLLVVEDAVRARLHVERTALAASHDWRVVTSVSSTPDAPSWAVGLGYRHYWGL
ncbi:hypothetical protein [Geochorda subterranea]|uniref:Uncharacterized protein n=1 Tax=Geochorda subterranea TaxID=3109564 RepID=A0ABZ1BU02_9FIRM|nr:hypothetical protein [Limnochorda sp. LNt]WRP15643.1 hypothetical protein VLY81_05630 [Limnochorda sp. LNt]